MRAMSRIASVMNSLTNRDVLVGLSSCLKHLLSGREDFGPFVEPSIILVFSDRAERAKTSS